MVKQYENYFIVSKEGRELPGKNVGYRHDGNRMLSNAASCKYFLDIDTIFLERLSGAMFYLC